MPQLVNGEEMIEQLTKSTDLGKGYQLGWKTSGEWLMGNWAFWSCKKRLRSGEGKTQISIGGINYLLNPEINLVVCLMVGQVDFMFLDIRKYEIHITKNIQLNSDKSLDLISNLQE